MRLILQARRAVFTGRDSLSAEFYLRNELGGPLGGFVECTGKATSGRKRLPGRSARSRRSLLARASASVCVCVSARCVTSRKSMTHLHLLFLFLHLFRPPPPLCCSFSFCYVPSLCSDIPPSKPLVARLCVYFPCLGARLSVCVRACTCVYGCMGYTWVVRVRACVCVYVRCQEEKFVNEFRCGRRVENGRGRRSLPRY